MMKASAWESLEKTTPPSQDCSHTDAIIQLFCGQVESIVENKDNIPCLQAGKRWMSVAYLGMIWIPLTGARGLAAPLATGVAVRVKPCVIEMEKSA